MLVVVIGGPIASGKSTLAQAVASRVDASVIDLDLVYEMLDPRRRPKSDDRLWTQARRVAGRLATILVDEGRHVVAEGDFETDQALAEFEHELPAGATVRLVMLDVDFEIALERGRADPSRGVSKDPTFLSAHYREFKPEWGDRDVLRLDTGELSLAEAARLVVDGQTVASARATKRSSGTSSSSPASRASSRNVSRPARSRGPKR